MDTNKKNREHISALSDGEIRDADQELALAALDTPDGRHAWNLYHHIGDILRAEGTADLSDGFAARLAERLAAEPAPGKRLATETGRVDGSTANI
jgi:sigma-E factor negative regulatory protein RseA